jgi:hypothetical protein
MGTKKMVKLEKRKGILIREAAQAVPGTLAPMALTCSDWQTLPWPAPDAQPAKRVLHSGLVPPIGTPLAESSGHTKRMAV